MNRHPLDDFAPKVRESLARCTSTRIGALLVYVYIAVTAVGCIVILTNGRRNWAASLFFIGIGVGAFMLAPAHLLSHRRTGSLGREDCLPILSACCLAVGLCALARSVYA
jgi:hypothetical protein